MDVGAVPRGTWWPREYYVVSAVALWGGGIAAVVALLSSEGDRARAVPLDRAPRRFAIIPAPGVRSVASGRFPAAGRERPISPRPRARQPRQVRWWHAPWALPFTMAAAVLAHLAQVA